MSSTSFFPYTREKNNLEITVPVQGNHPPIVTSPMNIIKISPRRNAYYTTVTGIHSGGDTNYIIGIRDSRGNIEAYFGLDNISLKPKRLLEDIEDGNLEFLQVTTYNEILNNIETRLTDHIQPQPNEDMMDPEEVKRYKKAMKTAIKQIKEMKRDFHSSLKDRRLYHYGMSVEGECFDGETHQYIGNYHHEEDHPALINYVYENLYKTITLRDQAINDVYTRYAIGKATRIIPELSRYLGEHGGKRKTKKRNNIKKSSKKKSKRIH
tara:strand:- start:1949 stop:2746 length:798 start_codon:yes stop_codon:yes gene_type:complete